MATTPTPLVAPDATRDILIDVADTVLADFFFDPDRELAYKALFPRGRRGAAKPAILENYAMDTEAGEVFVRLEALRTWTQFRVGFSGEGFQATIEGSFSFDRGELQPGAAVAATGPAEVIGQAAEALMDELDGPDLDDEELQNMQDLLDDGDGPPRIGDDPAEPPPVTALERSRVKAIAKRLAKMRQPNLGIEDRTWLELTPQTLPAITDAYVAAASLPGKQRDEALIEALGLMLSVQLECVRYRQDRGWDWANDMLGAYQQRVIALGEAGQMPQDDWFAMASAMNEARVPVPEDVQQRLAEAGFKGDPPMPGADLMKELRGFLDELATMTQSPFDVMEALSNAAAMMPAGLRGFLAAELALSPHPQLRDSVPLMLLDKDSAVRRDAASALEQNAAPDSLSPDSLRRVIAVRNWIPAKDRPALDSAVRKARQGGVVIAPWPAPLPDLECYATLLDGSGAQSVLVVSRSGRKGTLAGLLLRHGDGVIDAWTEQDMARAKMSRLLKEAFASAIFTRVEKPFADLVVQHAIAAGTRSGSLPPYRLLLAAEQLGGTEWQDRTIDVAAEAERLFLALDPAERAPERIVELHQAALSWMQDESVAGSWFEDGPAVRDALTGLPAGDTAALLAAVLERVLPPKRAEWAERFLLTALWCDASHEAAHRARAAGLVAVARALTGDGPLTDIPVMVLIALQTVRHATEGGW